MDASYAAGLFDGEGCVYADKTLRYIRGQIGMYTKEPLVILREDWGGSLHRRKADGCWLWVVTGAKLKSFLEAIKPYSLVKASPSEATETWFQTMYGPGRYLDDLGRKVRGMVRRKLQHLKREAYDAR